MCLLAICDTRHFDKDEFENAFKKNDDGFGYAYRTKTGLKYKKGIMNVSEAWTEYERFIKKHIFPHIVHFRLGSPVCKELTHPFVISKESELTLEGITDYDLLFHNGIISSWEDKLFNISVINGYLPEGKFSDTRMLALALSRAGNHVIEYVNGKFAILTKDSIITKGSFDNINGIRMSNDSYKGNKFKAAEIPSKYTHYEVTL
jgi:hypothetical protein